MEGDNLRPSSVSSLRTRMIIGVSCGNNYTLAWDDQGNLYTWGFGKHGVLGSGSEKDILEPLIVKDINEKVIYADAGFAHCGVVTESGNILMAGKACDGALGAGTQSAKIFTHFSPIQNPQGLRFTEISCSKGEHHGHTLALSTEGQVFAMGDGYKGKLGFGNLGSKNILLPIDNESFQGEKIKHVSAGGIHSTAVSINGSVYSWGCGSDGRLGHPEAKGHRYLFKSDTPRVIQAILDAGVASMVRASYYHTIALVD